jgi:hypothetical protein
MKSATNGATNGGGNKVGKAVGGMLDKLKAKGPTL